TSPVRWVAGKAPAAVPVPPAPEPDATDSNADVPDPVRVIQVGLEQGSAAKLGIVPGTELAIRLAGRGDIDVLVSGLYTPVDASAPVWTDFPDLLAASPPPAGVTADGTVGMLLSDESLADAAFWLFSQDFTADFRLAVVPNAVDAGSTHRVEQAIRRLYAH